MKLADWLLANNVSHQAFGDRIGKSQAAVSRYAAGLRRPDDETLIKIYVATDGDVTPNDFVDLPDLGSSDEIELDEAVDVPESSIA